MRLPLCGVARLIAATLFAVVFTTSAEAVTKQWENQGGGGDGLWTNAANWNPAGAPAAGDDVVIGNSQTAGNILLNASASVNSVSIVDPYITAPKLTVSNVTLTIASASSIASGTTLSINGILNGAGTLTVNGTLEWDGGTIEGTGGITVAAGGLLNIVGRGTTMYLSRTVSNSGTVVYDPATYVLYFYNGGGVQNGGVFDIQADFDINTAGTGPFVFANNSGGTFRKSGGSGNTNFYPQLNNNSGGVVDVQSGVLILQGGGSSASSAFTTTDTPSVSKLAIAGAGYTFTLGTAVNGNGILKVVNTLTVPSGVGITLANLHLSQAGTVLNGGGVVTVTNALDWDGGTMSGGGTTVVDDTATLTIGAPAAPATPYYKYLDNRTLTIDNMAVYNDGTYGLTMMNGALLNITATGTFDIQTGFNVYASGTASSITNAGTLRKTGGGGTSSIQHAVANAGSGTISATSGNLAFSSGLVIAGGTLNSGTVSNLDITGGLATFTGAATFTGTGGFRMNGGDVQIGSGVTQTIPRLSMLNSSSSLGGNGGTAILTGTFTWDQGELGLSSSTGGDVVINGTANFTNNYYKYLQYGVTLTNNGTINYTGVTYPLYVYNGSTIANAATFDIQGDASIFQGGTTPNTFTNSGTLQKSSGSGISSLGLVFDNPTGTVTVTSGTLHLTGGGANGGTITTTATSILKIGSTYTFNATSNLAGSNGTIDAPSGAVVVVPSGSITFPNFALTGGYLAGAGTAVLTGQPVFSGGQMGHPTYPGGTTVVDSAATLTLGGASSMILNEGRTLVNDGMMVFDPSAVASFFIYGTSLLDNNGTFDIQSDQDVFASATGTIDNSGTLQKSAGTDVTYIYPILQNNGGLVQSTAGVFDLGGNLAVATSTGGTYTANAPATIRFSSGTHSIDATSAWSGSGTFAVTSGNVTMAGSYDPATLVVTGGTLALNANGTVDTLMLNGSGILTGSGDLTILQGSTWSGGTMSGSGSTILSATRTMTIDGATYYSYLDARTLKNDGTIVYTAPSFYLQFSNNAVLDNVGTFDIQVDQSIYGASGGTITNSGLLKKSGGSGSSTLSNVIVHNTNLVEVTAGTLLLGGNGTHAGGTFTATAPATLAFSAGTQTLSGAGTLGGTGTIAFTGATADVGIAYSPATLSISAGTVNLNTNGSTNNFLFSNGTLGGTGTLTINGPATWSGGTMTGTGTTTLSAGQTMSMNGAVTYASLEGGRTFNNPGTINYTAPTFYFQIYNNAVLNNSGMFDIQTDQILYGFSNGAIENTGTIRKTAGSGSAALYPNLDNDNLVLVTSGTLELRGNGTHTGSFTATSPGVLSFAAGTHDLSGAGSISGTGTLRFNGANVSSSIPYAVATLNQSGGTATLNANGSASTFTFSGGNFGGSGTFTINGPATWSGGTMTGTGNTILTAGNTMAMTAANGYCQIETRTFTNNGTVNYSAANGSYYFYLYNNGTLQNTNAFNLISDQSIFAGTGGTINNSGALQRTTSATPVAIAAIVKNSNSVAVTTGSLALNGGGTHTGSFTATSPATLSFAGNHTFNAPGTLGGTGTIAFTSGTSDVHVAFNPGRLLISGGTANFNANSAVNILELTNGTLGGAGTLTVNSSTSWTGGTMAGSGATIFAGGTTTDIHPATYCTIDTRTVTNNGAIDYTGTNSIYLQIHTNGTLNNAGDFVWQTDGILYGFSGGVFDNSGSFSKSAGAATSVVYALFHNTGNVDVTAGIVQFAGGGTHTGAFSATAPSKIEFGGTHYVGAAGSLGGDGGYRFLSGIVDVDGTWGGWPAEITGGTMQVNTDGTLTALQQSGGVLGGSGDVTITGPTTWSGGTMSGAGSTTFDTGTTVTMPNTAYTTLTGGRTITNRGNLIYSGTAAHITVDSTTFTNFGTVELQSDIPFYGYGAGFHFQNNGILHKTAGSAISDFYLPLSNTGTVQVSAGTLRFRDAYLQTVGTTEVDSGAILATLSSIDNDGGLLIGGGEVQGNVDNGGVVAPGASPGNLKITGNYTQTANGTLDIELGGTTAGTQYDRLEVTGTATLDGALNITTINGFTPTSGNTFQIFTFGSRASGTDFAAKNGLSPGAGINFVPAYSATDLQLTTNATQADLSASVVASAGTVYANQTFTYTVTIANGGGSNASGVAFTAPIPANATFTSASPAVCSGAPLTCAIGNLANGASTSVVLTFTANTPGSATLNVSVAGSQFDPNGANNNASATKTITSSADLGITIADAPDPVQPGNDVTYTIVVTNNGPASATGVTVAATPSADNVFSSNSGACTAAFPCALGTLNSGQSVTITSTWTPSGGNANSVSLTVDVSASTPVDHVSANNSATATTALLESADVRITKSGPANASPTPGNVTYEIVVTNDGPSTANSVTVSDPAPAGYTFSSNSGACTTPFPCSLGALAAGQSATIHATYQYGSSVANTTVTNTATVNTTTTDPDTQNNSASASTTFAICPASISINAASSLQPGEASSASTNLVSGATYNWTITNGTLTGGQGTSSVTFTAGASGTTTLGVTVTTNACARSASHAIAVTNTQADVSLTKSAPQNVASASTFAYTLLVSNNGPNVADDVQLFDTLPPNVSLVSIDDPNCSGTSNIGCNFGSLAPGETRTVTLNVLAPEGPVSIDNVADVASATADPQPSNNQSSAHTNVLAGIPCPTGIATLIAPAPGEVITTDVTFSWSAVADATGYVVLISVNGGATQAIGSTTDATTLTAAVPAGAIAWSVETQFGNCTPTRSAISTFTVSLADPCGGRTTPVLASPSNGSTTPSAVVTFQWNAVFGASEYRVWLQPATGEPLVLGSTLGTSLEEVILAGTHQWYVEALFDGCASTESPKWTFTVPAATNCDENGQPALLSPANGATTAAALVTFSWSAVPNAIEYELWIALGTGTPTLAGTTNATSLDTEVPEGNIEWFVRAIFAGCPPTESAHRTFTYAPAAACDVNERPVLIAPAEGEQVGLPVAVEWSAVAGATRYDVFVASGNQQPALVATTNAPNATLNVPLGAARFFVRAHFAQGCPTLDSTESRFVVIPAAPPCAALDAPVIAAPPQLSHGAQGYVQWSFVPGATSYSLQLSADPEFLPSETSTINMGLTRKYAFELANTTGAIVAHYLRVRAVDADCIPVTSGPFSSTAIVYVLPSNSSDASTLLGSSEDVEYWIDLGPELAGQTFVTTPSASWITVTPPTGIVPAAGIRLRIDAETQGLPPGTSIGTVSVTLTTPSSGGYTAQATTSFAPSFTLNKVSPVLPTPKNTPPPDALIIPAVANANGINSHFQSDVRVSNTSAQVMKYQLSFVPTGEAGIANGKQTTFSIEPGGTVALDDILKTWFGTGTTDAIGTLEIRPLTEVARSTSSLPVAGLQDLVTFASSRTFNVTPNGTFGQFIPAVPFANFIGRAPALAAPAVLSLQQIAQSDRFRTNLGIVEGSGNPASLLIKVFGPTGQKLTEFPLNLAGGQHTQLNSFLTSHGIDSLADGRVEIAVTSDGGKVTAYASVLDKDTNDPLLVTPVTLTDSGNTKWVMPGVADLRNSSANWQSDMRLFNAGTADVDATLWFYSQNGGAPKSVNVTLPAGQVRQFDKTLSSLFGVTNDGGAVHITTPAAARLITTARTYNQTAGGTYGQFISAVTAGEAAGLGSRPLQLLQIEESPRFRSNIGLAEVTGNPVKLQVSIVPPDGKFTAVTEVTLQPNEFRQFTSMLKQAGLDGTYNARVTVRVLEGTGRVTAYASVIDRQTNDPTYVPAQ